MTALPVAGDSVAMASWRSSKILKVVLAAVLAAGTVPLVSSAAHAVAPCSGSRVGRHPVKDGRLVLGYVDLYYASNGYNCALLQAKKYRGTPQTALLRQHLSVSLLACPRSPALRRECMETPLPPARHGDSDSGTYRFYAGPVKVYGRDRCVRWRGEVRIYEARTLAHRGVVDDGGHCG
ncbi:hypothetical protein ETD86_46505 [Nonomuraea turkmeniaca]|uniref:Uncharacterized protein n=1 Tax=Nonomuraea turkmeniaca TaxID=103838 RepID=A0A5S4EYQ7_9ACTN|nr:hypothetical protein [Nonomuraea turkmeniaca]TMR08739.1 hypothetical protein ETD86_46505 [Nonomuraea turkmeniaca]